MNAYAERLESSNALGSVTEVLPLLDVNPEASSLGLSNDRNLGTIVAEIDGDVRLGYQQGQIDRRTEFADTRVLETLAILKHSIFRSRQQSWFWRAT